MAPKGFSTVQLSFLHEVMNVQARSIPACDSATKALRRVISSFRVMNLLAARFYGVHTFGGTSKSKRLP